ncbi:condensation domain-containing protein, partial [Pseudophaeobacter sp.]|uniref:condensation domain-containing protein n=1 Tax=Pseudophaeobacter sp. TaxID=1971739 RepID=UPI0040593D04
PEARRYEPPQGEIETAIAQIWQDLLGLDSISRSQSFLEAGGDSLVATRVITRLRDAGLEPASLTRLFSTPVLSEFAEDMRFAEAVTGPGLVIDPANLHEVFPPTEVQRAYWMGRNDDFDLGGVSCHFYTEWEADYIDMDRLEAVWNQLVQRHDMLRAVFVEDGQQRILSEVPQFKIPNVACESDTGNAALAAMREAMSDQVIDPLTWPLFDIRAVQYGAKTRLGVSFDSIIIDALSTMILLSEMETLYRDPISDLRPIGLSFRDYVTSVEPAADTLEADRAYWALELETLPPGPKLPLAKTPADVGKPVFKRRRKSLSAKQLDRLRGRARDHALTPSSVLVTAFSQVLAKWSGEPDFTINLTLFDRREVHPDINNVVGDFTSLMLLPCGVDPQEGWLASAERMQRKTIENLSHSSVSGIWVMRELARRNGALDDGMPVIFTSTLGSEGILPPPVEAPRFSKVWGLSQTPQIWIDCQIVEEADGALSVTWDVVEDLFPAGVIDGMFAAYVGLLDRLCGDEAQWDRAVALELPAAQ